MSRENLGPGRTTVSIGKAARLASRRGPVAPQDQDIRQRELKSWESIWTGFKGRIKYSRQWNSGYDGPGKGTW